MILTEYNILHVIVWQKLHSCNNLDNFKIMGNPALISSFDLHLYSENFSVGKKKWILWQHWFEGIQKQVTLANSNCPIDFGNYRPYFSYIRLATEVLLVNSGHSLLLHTNITISSGRTCVRSRPTSYIPGFWQFSQFNMSGFLVYKIFPYEDLQIFIFTIGITTIDAPTS